jgi:hypothetical protein
LKATGVVEELRSFAPTPASRRGSKKRVVFPPKEQRSNPEGRNRKEVRREKNTQYDFLLLKS